MLINQIKLKLNINLERKKKLSSSIEYHIFMQIRRFYVTEIAEEFILHEEKPVDLFRVVLKKGRGKVLDSYQKKGREGNYWSVPYVAQYGEKDMANFDLWRYLMYAYSKKEDKMVQRVREMTKEEQIEYYLENLEPANSDNLYTKRKYGTILDVEVSLEKAILGGVEIAYYGQNLLKKEEILGPNLSVFLFLLDYGLPLWQLSKNIEISFEMSYWLVVGSQYIQEVSNFSYIQECIKEGKISKVWVEEIKHPKLLLLKKIESLLNTVQEVLQYQTKGKQEEEENVILPRMYPFPGTKNVLPRVKNFTFTSLEKKQPEEVQEVRKEKIDIKNLLKEEEFKKEIKSIRNNCLYFLGQAECEKYIKTILGIIFRQYLQEIALSQTLEEKYNQYLNLRKNHLEFVYRKNLEEIEEMKKEEKEKLLKEQAAAFGYIGVEGVLEIWKDGNTINKVSDEEREKFENQMVGVYHLALFLGVYRGLYLFAGEIEKNELGTKDKHTLRTELSFVRENIAVPLFWILFTEIFGKMAFKIEGKEQFAQAIDQIPANGILKANIWSYKYFGDERTVEKAQEVVWDVSQFLS